jgi:hypothetical protein
MRVKHKTNLECGHSQGINFVYSDIVSKRVIHNSNVKYVFFLQLPIATHCEQSMTWLISQQLDMPRLKTVFTCRPLNSWAMFKAYHKSNQLEFTVQQTFTHIASFAAMYERHAAKYHNYYSCGRQFKHRPNTKGAGYTPQQVRRSMKNIQAQL